MDSKEDLAAPLSCQDEKPDEEKVVKIEKRKVRKNGFDMPLNPL